MAFRRHFGISMLMAHKVEQDHRARLAADAEELRAAVQEVRARRDLLYPPLNRLSKEKHG